MVGHFWKGLPKRAYYLDLYAEKSEYVQIVLERFVWPHLLKAQPNLVGLAIEGEP